MDSEALPPRIVSDQGAAKLRNKKKDLIYNDLECQRKKEQHDESAVSPSQPSEIKMKGVLGNQHSPTKSQIASDLANSMHKLNIFEISARSSLKTTE